MGLFGNSFDFNRDGRLDSLERAVEFNTFRNLIDSDEENDEEDE